MKRSLSALVMAFAGIGAALPALAQVEPPHRKSGMWE